LDYFLEIVGNPGRAPPEYRYRPTVEKIVVVASALPYLYPSGTLSQPYRQLTAAGTDIGQFLARIFPGAGGADTLAAFHTLKTADHSAQCVS